MKNIKIFFSNPNENIIEALRAYFKPLGYELILNDDLLRAADEDFSLTDLIIMDPNMGDAGIATGVIDTLKSRIATSRIPILLCSHQSNQESIINGLNAGASDFIQLPSPNRTLYKRIRALLRQ